LHPVLCQLLKKPAATMKKPAVSVLKTPAICDKMKPVLEFMDGAKFRGHTGLEKVLFRVVSAADLLHGKEGELNFFKGGNGFVRLRKMLQEGVYLGMIKFVHSSECEEGPIDPVGTVVSIEWFAAAPAFQKMIDALAKRIRHSDRLALAEMMRFNSD